MPNIQLKLMIGPLVPVPVPQSVVEALQGVHVTSGENRSGFQLTFAVSNVSPLLKTMLPAGYFDPMVTRVIVIVILDGFPNVLMDGIVTRQELAPSDQPGQSTLTITGEDLSVMMDVVEIKRPFPAMPKIAQLYTVLAPYLSFGIVPLLIPPIISVVDTPTKKIKAQYTTDRAFIRRAAHECGYVFYVEPGPLPGQSIAYFGPDIRLPVPQHALSVNMGAQTNVEKLTFTLDGLAKKVKVITIFDPITKKIPIPIPIPNISVFKPPLGARLTPPARIEFGTDYTKKEPDEAAESILGELMDSSDAISVTGSLDVLQYGHVLRSRMLVGVRGASLAYDGLYYVNSVTHDIKPKTGEYKIDFELSRDGLISITPKVLP